MGLCLPPDQREGMREAGRFNAQLMDFVRTEIREGMTTKQIDQLVETYTRDHGHVPATFGYRGYPKNCCTSMNDVVCHGIPDETILRSGDIVNVDIASIVDGWHGDQSETFLLGDVSEEARQLVQVCFESLWKAIDALSPGCRVSQIGRAIVEHARPHGYGVVEDYQGHGLGRKFHQKPDIPHFPETKLARQILYTGLCFTVEPMINQGTKEVKPPLKDWIVHTKDGKLSAQFEHTILMTEDGPEVLTLTKEGPQKGHVF